MDQNVTDMKLKLYRFFSLWIGNLLQALLSKINEHSFESTNDESGNAVNSNSTSGNSTNNTGSGVTGVNKAIQQLAQRYCGDCKSSFEELGKIIQKVLATRKELVEYDRQQRDSSVRPVGPSTPISRESLLRSLCGRNTEESQNLSSGRYAFLLNNFVLNRSLLRQYYF